MESWLAILGGLRGYLRPMVQGENAVGNMAKHDNNRLPLREFYMHAVRTSIKYNERMENARKGSMLAAVLSDQ